MTEKQEIFIAKIITALIIVVTLLCYAAQADSAKIAKTFMKHNRKLSEQTAKELSEIVTQTGKCFSIDPDIIAAIIINESTVRANAISKHGDYGLMQVRWKVHYKDIQKQFPQVKNANGLLNPRINIFIGTQIFARYYAQKNTVRGGLLRYSAGNRKLADKVLRTVSELKNH